MDNFYIYFVSETFLEAVPQVLIILVLFFSDNTGAELNSVLGTKKVLESGLPQVTFILSLFTATFGIARFLKNGPARIVRDEGCLDGFGTMTFILIFHNVAATLVGKGYVIAITISRIAQNGDSKVGFLLILLLFPAQLIHVCSLTLMIITWHEINLCLSTLTGIWYSLPCARIQRGNKNNRYTASNSINSSLHILDNWSREVWGMRL